MSVLTAASTGSMTPSLLRPRPCPFFQPIFSRSAKPRPLSTGASLLLDSASFSGRGTLAPDALIASEPITTRRFTARARSSSYRLSALPPACAPRPGPPPPDADECTTIELQFSGGGGGGSPLAGSQVSWSGWSPEGPSSCLTSSLSSSERSASWSPPPQCHAVFAVISAWSTSFSSCLASAPPASALSMRMPAVRRWKNCCTDSPGRRVSIPETAFCRQSSWSSAEPGS
mmetsp:Transcript_272/g.723  ORF Transcript_272/g.723 Transcript_272/m.723 type:complete len:230 (-) Transcript_272:679-1368(-)